MNVLNLLLHGTSFLKIILEQINSAKRLARKCYMQYDALGLSWPELKLKVFYYQAREDIALTPAALRR